MYYIKYVTHTAMSMIKRANKEDTIKIGWNPEYHKIWPERRIQRECKRKRESVLDIAIDKPIIYSFDQQVVMLLWITKHRKQSRMQYIANTFTKHIAVLIVQFLATIDIYSRKRERKINSNSI